MHLMLKVRLQRTKRQRMRRQDPKTFTFNVDDNPMFCFISHLLVLAYADSAYAAPKLDAPEKPLALTAESGMRSLPIPFKEKILSYPIFRCAVRTRAGYQISLDKTLRYSTYHP